MSSKDKISPSLTDLSSQVTPDHEESLKAKQPSDDFVVTDEQNGARLDAYLALVKSGFSRSRFKELIKTGNVTVNSQTSTSPNLRLKMGDKVELLVPPPQDPLPTAENIPLDVAYEDNDLIVINKPAGMVVHPAAGNWDGTLVNALLYHCGDSLSGVGGVKRPGIVHRLDKDTSGLLVVAKNDHAHQSLAAQFADHGRTGPLRRAYKALVWEAPSPSKGTVETMIGRAPNNRLKMAVLEDSGRVAITHYQTDVSYFDHTGKPLATLITCKLETGRTHQIRVHMTHIGVPLVGDPTYGAHFSTKAQKITGPLKSKLGKFRRQALHAYLLGFEHPTTSETLEFECELPQDMSEVISGFEESYTVR